MAGEGQRKHQLRAQEATPCVEIVDEGMLDMSGCPIPWGL